MAHKDTNLRRNEKEVGKTTKQNQGSEKGANRTDLARGESFMPATWSGSPFSFMRRFSEEMDRLFENFGFGRGFAGDLGALSGLRGSLWSPQVEVFERGKQLVVRADLPGLTKDDIDVNITDDEIVIKGERKQESEENEEGYYRSERSYGSFYRSIPLPEGINADDANATFRNGVLEITIPAPERAEKRRKRLEIREGAAEQTRAKAAGR